VVACDGAYLISRVSPDDARLSRVHKKGFVEAMKRASDEEVDEWAGLYPVWYLRKFHRMPVLWSKSKGKARVYVPKLRSHRQDYYAWFRYVPLPSDGYWYLLTLTLYRSVGLRQAWQNINRWTSRFLNRFRVYLKKQYGREIEYVWVVEKHKDEFPHVHILFVMPYVQELNFSRLLSMFQSYWVDDEGNPLCAPHGVDLKCIGRNVQEVRSYVLKYLDKGHGKYWRFDVLPDGSYKVHRSTGYIWLFKVRLFGISQGIRKRLREWEARRKEGRSSDWVFMGSVSANRVHKLYYRRLGIDYFYWVLNLPEVGYLEYPESFLPELVPSAFSARGSPADDVYDELMEAF
jgi:hypothetical protein